jgi:hypothetical protein
MSAVYKAIAAVQGELSKVGISKDGQNTQQNYKFRGIDQVYGALSPLLAKHGLCVLPRIVEREMHERVTVKEWNGSKKESVLFYVTVTAEFDFVAVADGSSHTVRTYGEAMDSGDKATNKAMSAAYKYAAFMAFAIPTEGDNDADATTHDVAPRVDAGKGQSQIGTVSPHPVITPAQAEELRNLASEVGADLERFCKFLKIASIPDLPASQFDEAKSALESKRQKEAA